MKLPVLIFGWMFAFVAGGVSLEVYGASTPFIAGFGAVMGILLTAAINVG